MEKIHPGENIQISCVKIYLPVLCLSQNDMAIYVLEDEIYIYFSKFFTIHSVKVFVKRHVLCKCIHVALLRISLAQEL